MAPDIVVFGHRGERPALTADGRVLAHVDAGERRFTVLDRDGTTLCAGHVEALIDWFVVDADGRGVIRLQLGLGRRHRVTFADGRIGRIEEDLVGGMWQLTDDDDGHLVIHVRPTGNAFRALPEWTAAQDGSLDLVAFLATVETFRRARHLRREVVRSL